MSAMFTKNQLAHLGATFGIYGIEDFLKPGIAHDIQLAMDAQPQLVTVSNSGIPAYLANIISPKVIQVLVTPNKAATILGETKNGDWVTLTQTFPMIERTGEASSYGDYSDNGSTSANAQFPQRDSYHYQTITQWGEKQLAQAGLAKIDWAQQLNLASAVILDKFQNQTYFYGVTGLRLYGLLNDPRLPTPIQPSTKAAGGRLWTNATPNEIYADIQTLYAQLVTATGGLIDEDSKMVLCMPPGTSIFLKNTNIYNMNVFDMLKKNFSKIRFETAPQYATAGGNLVQLICEEVEGQETGYCAFTEKMRAHAVIQELSAFKQKKSQGTWGAIIFNPYAFGQMLGV